MYKFEDLVKIKSNKDLELLPTKRLLSYYKSERKRRIKFRERFFTGYEYSYYLYKEDKYILQILNNWEEYLLVIKNILNTREHIKKN